MTPTRELALQVSADLAAASAERAARIVTVYGGVGYDTQLDTLRDGVEIVVGTPGRLLDLADRGSWISVRSRSWCWTRPTRCSTLDSCPMWSEFSARRLSCARRCSFRRPCRPQSSHWPAVTSGTRSTSRAESPSETTMVPATAQFVYQAHDLDKPEVVARILQAENRGRVMIFCRTKRSAQRVADDLVERGFAAAVDPRRSEVYAREKALRRFREGRSRRLVATDVAARGIDVEGVTHVINYECPEDDKNYIHRIGRTGRAGASGIAITFVDWADQTRWKVINNILGLPFEQPQETYSTSPHLYHDLGIDPGAKGRIAPPRSKPAEPPPQPRERPARRSRTRQRLRNGIPVARDENANPDPTVELTVPSAEAADAEPAPRRRRRRRDRRSAWRPSTSPLDRSASARHPCKINEGRASAGQAEGTGYHDQVRSYPAPVRMVAARTGDQDRR